MPIVYRDRAYCSATCTTTDCSRNITPEVQAAADAWWGGAPGEAPFSKMAFNEVCTAYHPPEEAA